MLICDRDAVSFIIRAALGTCPLLFMAGHYLVSSCVPTGALLDVVYVAVLSNNSLSSATRYATPVSASRCVAANYTHLLDNTLSTSLEPDQALQSSKRAL